MGTRKQFTPEFKREAVQVLEDGSRPVSALARALSFRSTLRGSWRRNAWRGRFSPGEEISPRLAVPFMQISVRAQERLVRSL